MDPVDRMEKTPEGRTSACNDAPFVGPSEVTPAFTSVQPLSSRVLADFRALKNSTRHLLKHMLSSWEQNEGMITTMVHCQVLAEVLSELRLVHNQILDCPYFKNVAQRHGLSNQLSGFRLSEKVDISINLSKLFSSDLLNASVNDSISEQSNPAQFLNESSRHHHQHIEVESYSHSPKPHFRGASLQNSTPRSLKIANKFVIVSHLFKNELISQSERAKLKNLIVQENEEVLAVFNKFKDNSNLQTLAARLKKILSIN